MRIYILIILGILNFAFCEAQSDFVILNDQQTINELITTFKVLPETAKTTELTQAEFDLCKKKYKECIENYNNQITVGFKKRGEKRKYAKMYKIMELQNYKIQYVPYLNDNGEKEIWINGFCKDFDSGWGKKIISVFEGGNCFFTIRLNLSTGECLEIGTNGYA